jgi:hypothetical protein
MAPGEFNMAENDKLPTEVESLDTVPSPGTDVGDVGSLLDVSNRGELRGDYMDANDGDSPPRVARKSARDSEPELPEEATPEEIAKLSKTAQRRIRKLQSQRYKLASEIKRLTPDAAMAAKVTEYLRSHDIGQDDFLFGLELMAAMRRGDFVKFYEGVKPYMKLCEEYLGISLPPDLQQSVNAGHMTTQAAALYSRERMDKAMAQTNAVKSQAMLQQHQNTSAKEVLANRVAAAVNNWEAQIERSDPHYATKKNAVQTAMMALVQEKGPPRSPEHGIQIAEEAYRRATKQYQEWTGQRRPTSRVPSSTGRTAGVAPEATTLLEAVRFAREGAPRL